MNVLLSGKILVAGGFTERDRNISSLEIIDLINTKLKSDIVVDVNGSRGGATGGILQNQPLICGGHDDDGDFNIKTNVLLIGMPNNGFEMMIPRTRISSVVLNESIMWITGGLTGSFDGNELKSTEFFSFDRPPVQGPDLQFTVYCHSMVLLNPTTIYLIGGFQNDQRSNNTWIIDPTNDFQIKAGPSLNIARSVHSCSKMRIKGRIFLVVAGGYSNTEPLDSVELLDTTCPDQGWVIGMK